MRLVCLLPSRKLLEIITKKHKTSGVKTNHVKNHLWVFVNAQIENPAFDSQVIGNTIRMEKQISLGTFLHPT